MAHNIELTDYVARVEQTVRDNLRGARVIALIETEADQRDGYWERIYMVAWEREDQCGTHRVCVNSRWEQAAFIGHYDMTGVDAILDMLKRAGR
jgi:hypothetical protein